MVDGGHDFRRPAAEEAAEGMPAVFLGFVGIVEDHSRAVRFIDPIRTYIYVYMVKY